MKRRLLAGLLCLALLSVLPGISGIWAGVFSLIPPASAAEAAGDPGSAALPDEYVREEEPETFTGRAYVTDGISDKGALLPQNSRMVLTQPSDDAWALDGAVRKSYALRLPAEEDPTVTETFFAAAGPKAWNEPEGGFVTLTLDLTEEGLWAEDFRTLQFSIAFEDAEGDFPLTAELVTSAGRLETSLTLRTRALEDGGIQYGRNLVKSAGGWSTVTLDLSDVSGLIEGLTVRVMESVFPVNTVFSAPLLLKDPTDELIMADRYASYSIDAGPGSFSFMGIGGVGEADANGRLLLSGTPALSHPIRAGVPCCFEIRASGNEKKDARLSIGIDYRDGLERIWSPAVTLNAEDGIYVIQTEPLSDIAAFYLLFEDLGEEASIQVDGLRIITGGSVWSAGNDWLGQLTRIERSGKEIVFAGSMVADTLRAFSGGSLRFYAVPSPLLLKGENEDFFAAQGSVVLPESAVLIGEAKISTLFEKRYTLPPMPVSPDACVYFACVSDPEAEEAVLLLSPPRYTDTDSSLPSPGSRFIFGLADTFPAGVFESNAFHILADVPLDTMLTASGTSVVYTVPGENAPRTAYLDPVLLEELNRDVEFYHSAGIAVYLRFLLNNPAEGLTAPDTFFPETDSPASVALWCALIRFFTARYPYAAGLVLPGPINDPDTVGYTTEEIGSAAERAAHLGRLTWSAAAEKAPDAFVCFSMDDRRESTACSAVLLTLLSRRIEQFGDYPWSCVLAAGPDSALPTSLDWILDQLEDKPVPDAFLYIYQLSQAELNSEYARYLVGQSDLGTGKIASTAAMAAAMYGNFCKAGRERGARAVFFSPALLDQRNDHAFYDELRKSTGDENAIKVADVQNQFILPGMVFYDLWDFADAYYPLDWIPGGGALSCSTELSGPFSEIRGLPSRVLSASFQESKNGVAGIVMRNLNRTLDLTAVSALYFDFLLEDTGDTPMEEDAGSSLVFIVGTDDRRVEYHIDGVRCGEVRRLSCPLTEWEDRERADFIAVAVYAGGPVSLKLSRVTAMGRNISDEQLQAVFEPMPDKDGRSSMVWLLPALVFTLAGSCVIFVLLDRRDREDGYGGTRGWMKRRKENAMKNQADRDRIEREARAFAKEGADRLNIAQNVRPFTKYKIMELILCAAAVILGLLYLYTDPKLISLDILLPVYAAVFCALVPLRWMDLKANGVKGGFAVFTTAVWGVLALVVVAAAVIYFRGA